MTPSRITTNPAPGQQPAPLERSPGIGPDWFVIACRVAMVAITLAAVGYGVWS
jgi:hypothetical protein